MEKELENIFGQIATDLHNKPRKNELIALTGWKEGESKEEIAVTINETDKYAEFRGEYKQKARSMKELKLLLDYLDRNKYETNLD